MPSLLQNLPQGWEVKILGEVCEITMGQSPKGEQVFSHNKISSCHSNLECNEREEFQKDSTLRDISATPQYDNTKIDNDFMEFHQGKICFTDKYISESEFVTTDIKKIAEKDSILLCVRAPVGIINITKRKVAIGRGLCALKMKNQNNDFLYFYLLTLENYFNQKATGSTFSAITMNVVKNTPIPLPPIETQKAIVEKLENAFAHIDEAVRHLKAVQTNIPRLKSSLLHCAFSGKLTESQITTPASTLSFSQRKSNPSPLPLTKETLPFFCTKGEPAHSPLLAKNRAGGTTAPAFSDFSHHEVGAESHYDCHSKALAKESKDNNTHILPQGWEVKTLGEIGKVVSGGTPSTSNKDNFDGEIAWITPADLSGYKEKYISKGKRNLSEQGLKNSSARLLPPNSILFSSRAPIGYVAIASNTLCTNQGFKNLIPHSNVSSEYIYYFLLYSKRLAESVASGTTFKEISATNFSKLPIPLPPLETQNQIVQILESKFAHLEKLAQFVNASLENLQSLKSSLLNQAFKGELIC